MPISDAPIRAVNALQAFHGFEIYVSSESVGRGTRVWELHVPETGFRLRGNHAQIMACIKGYQAGYLAGRKYTRVESDGLKALIREVEAKFGKGA